MGENLRELPKYQCHKEVWALKIKGVGGSNLSGVTRRYVIPENEQYARIDVTQEWMDKHKPTGGGYYVQYKDGYTSFSPASEFEDGYTLIK